MNSQESKFLFKEKAYIEEKGELQANKELVYLEHSQKDFKKLWNENEKNKKEIERLDKELSKSREKNFKESFKKLTETPKEYKGSLLHLKRILNNMEVGKRYTIKNLSSELCMCNEDLNGCLAFLEETKLLKLDHPSAGGVIRNE